MEEELRLEIAKLRLELALTRRSMERLAVVFDTAARLMRLEEPPEAEWLDPTETREKPRRRRGDQPWWTVKGREKP